MNTPNRRQAIGQLATLGAAMASAPLLAREGEESRPIPRTERPRNTLEYVPEAHRATIALFSFMDEAEALLDRHAEENPDGCECTLCDDLTHQVYLAYWMAHTIEGELIVRPGSHLEKVMKAYHKKA